MDTYEKKYKEAIKKAKKDLEVCEQDCLVAKQIFRYFPELRESEDERIRKAMINGFNKLDKGGEWFNGITNGQILAWLEKQGKEKPAFKMKSPEESLGIDSDTYNKIVDECIYGDDKQKPVWSEQDREMIDETLYFIREYQQSNRCKDENGMQNSVTCEKWLKSLKQRIGG